MKVLKFLAAASILMTAGCSHYSDDLSSLDKQLQTPAQTQVAVALAPQDIAPAAGGAMASESFSRDLAQEYYDLARFENDRAFDYKSSRFFTGKAVGASRGELIVPSKVSSYDVPANLQGDLNEARKSLIAALKQQNTPENARSLARAQARYECWLERAEEAADSKHYETCRSEFEQAMATLVTPAAGGDAVPATVYTVKFPQGAAAIIDPAAVKTIELVAQFLNDPSNAAYTASLTGFSTQPGTGATDPAVVAQVTAVRDALIERGIASARLSPMVAPAGAVDAGSVQVGLIAPPETVVTPYSSTTTRFVPVAPMPVTGQ